MLESKSKDSNQQVVSRDLDEADTFKIESLNDKQLGNHNQGGILR